MPKTFFGNDINEIKLLRDEFMNCFSRSTLLTAIDSFKWGKNSEDSKKEREEVTHKFKLWLSNGKPIVDAQAHADLVMEWGFNGQKSPKSLSENLAEFCNFISTWEKKDSASDMKNLLARNLQVKGIGIARSSKWLCFINPEELCIYDSRVSVTLRTLGKGKGKTFPTVGRKKTNRTSDFPNPNFRKPEKMAEDYCKFLDLVDAIKLEYQIDSASKIEMGLFMLGDNPNIWRK